MRTETLHFYGGARIYAAIDPDLFGQLSMLVIERRALFPVPVEV